MYSPYLYARSTELLCLRDLVAKGVSLNGLLPILEPINVNTRNLLTCLNVWNSDIIVILNPYQEDFSSHNNVLTLNQNLSSVLTNKNNIISGYLIQPNTTINDINNWMNANLNRRVALLYDNPSLSNSDIQLLATNQLISYHVVLNNKMLPNQCALLPLSKLIIISDNFRKLAKNADYNGPELFTHAHQFVGQNYLGFGDYTITGQVLDLGGGQPSAVAAHLVFKNLQANTVWIRHFVSSNTQRGSSNVTAKFLDVSDQITNLVPQHPTQFGSNIGLNYYYYNSQPTVRHFPGLPKNKQYQITHHICFMLDLIAGRI
ncbi:TPA: sce7725 family protein [Escherichia coli]|nr:sce7725 family protein [Escherichia coli]